MHAGPFGAVTVAAAAASVVLPKLRATATPLHEDELVLGVAVVGTDRSPERVDKAEEPATAAALTPEPLSTPEMLGGLWGMAGKHARAARRIFRSTRASHRDGGTHSRLLVPLSRYTLCSRVLQIRRIRTAHFSAARMVCASPLIRPTTARRRGGQARARAE